MSKVAVIPLSKFTTESEHKLIADMATSVERNATLSLLRDMAARQPQNSTVLQQAIVLIQQGRHA